MGDSSTSQERQSVQGPDISPEVRAAREQLRKEHNVRLVAGDEEGCSVSRLPDGVYGFTHSPLGEAPLFAKATFHGFEIHKTAGGQSRMLVFATPSDAALVRAGDRAVEVRLYPDRWETATELIAVAMTRLAGKRLLPSREPGNWIAATVYPTGSDSE